MKAILIAVGWLQPSRQAPACDYPGGVALARRPG